MNGLLGVLGLRSARDDADIRALQGAWPEYDYEWSRGAWHAYPLNGAGEPVSARTTAALLTAVREAWIATGRSR